MGELHAALVQRAVRWLRNTVRCTAALAECGSIYPEIPDAIGWTARGLSIVVECKTSIGDFYADRSKPSARSGKQPGNYRYYFAPAGVLRIDLIPEPWGFIELVGDRVMVRKKPTLREPDRTLDVALLVAELRRVTGGWRHQRESLGIAADARCENEHPQSEPDAEVAHV